MARRVTSKDKVFRDVLRILEVKEKAGDSLLIVNLRLFQQFVENIPKDKITSFLERKLDDPKLMEDLPFGEWIKSVRELYDASQREFAALVTSKGLRIYGSDIGNLESGHRMENYRATRLNKIKKAVQELLNEKKQKEAPPK